MLVFDTETTGLTLHPDAELQKQPRIIEFGAALLDRATGAIVDEINILINPGVSVSDEIIKITGITDEDLKDARNFHEELPRIASFFARAEVVVAHNLPFDKAMIMNELRRLAHNHALATEFPWPKREICTVGLYKDVYGYNPRLIELYADIIGKKLEQSHRALDDVHALVEIIQKEELYNL